MKMKTLKLNYMILLVIALIFSSVSVFAQQENNESGEQEIIIIKETINEDGNVEVTKIIKKGSAEDLIIKNLKGGDGSVFDIEDAENIHVINLESLEGLTPEMQEKLKNIHINIDEDATQRHIKVIIDKDGSAEPVIIEWEGEGEIPDDVKMKMHEYGVIMNGDDVHEAHAYGFVTRKHKSNKACLGVMIGKTVESENGVENVRGESDQGVTILDIIDDSGAEEAGLLKDDIITGINGTGVSTIDNVLEALKPFEGGAVVSIDYLRGGQPAQVNATLKGCKNKMETKHFENFEGNNFEFKEDMNWVFKSDEGEGSQSKRIIIIKKKTENDDNPEKLEIVPGEDNEAAGIETVETVAAPSKNIPNSLKLKDVSLFPNPTAGNLNVEFKGDAVPTIVKIIDITGKEIYREELIDFDGNYKKEINLGNAPKGTLMLTVKQNDKIFAEKVVVQ